MLLYSPDHALMVTGCAEPGGGPALQRPQLAEGHTPLAAAPVHRPGGAPRTLCVTRRFMNTQRASKHALTLALCFLLQAFLDIRALNGN